MFNGDIKNIEDVALYMNLELQKGRTQKDIEITDFRVNERVIEKRLKRNGYKKINNEYIKPKDIEVLKNNKVVTSVISNKKNKVMTSVINNENSKVMTSVISNENNKMMTSVISKEELEHNLFDLLKNYDKLKFIINDYEKRSQIIRIDLPLEEKEIRTTVRVNQTIWNEFNEFSDNNKEFTKKDLISMALKEYMDKYK